MNEDDYLKFEQAITGLKGSDIVPFLEACIGEGGNCQRLAAAFALYRYPVDDALLEKLFTVPIDFKLDLHLMPVYDRDLDRVVAPDRSQTKTTNDAEEFIEPFWGKAPSLEPDLIKKLLEPPARLNGISCHKFVKFPKCHCKDYIYNILNKEKGINDWIHFDSVECIERMLPLLRELRPDGYYTYRTFEKVLYNYTWDINSQLVNLPGVREELINCGYLLIAPYYEWKKHDEEAVLFLLQLGVNPFDPTPEEEWRDPVSLYHSELSQLRWWHLDAIDQHFSGEKNWGQIYPGFDFMLPEYRPGPNYLGRRNTKPLDEGMTAEEKEEIAWEDLPSGPWQFAINPLWNSVLKVENMEKTFEFLKKKKVPVHFRLEKGLFPIEYAILHAKGYEKPRAKFNFRYAIDFLIDLEKEQLAEQGIEPPIDWRSKYREELAIIYSDD